MKPPPEEDFAALLAGVRGQERPPGRARRAGGDSVRGRVISLGRKPPRGTGGGKSEGMIELQQLRDEDGNLTVKVGDEIEAHVVETMGKSVAWSCAGPRSRRGPEAKAELQQAAATGLAVEGTVTGVNKGGVEVLVAGVRGFCPISQLEMRHVEDASEYVGRKLEFRITRYDVDRRGDNLVVSRRALLEAEAQRALTRFAASWCRARSCPAWWSGSKISARSSTWAGSRACCLRPSWGSRAGCGLLIDCRSGKSLRSRSCAWRRRMTPNDLSGIRCRSSRWSEILGRTWPSSSVGN